MGTNRKRILRTKKDPVTQLSEGLARMLLFGECEKGTPEYDLYLSRHFDGGEKLNEVFKVHKDSLMALWKKEGHAGVPWVLDYFRHKEKLERI